MGEIKGTGTEAWLKALSQELGKDFGKHAVKERECEHCGIQHVHLSDYPNKLTQNEYRTPL